MADTKISDIHTQAIATGNSDHSIFDHGNITFPVPDWTWIDPYYQKWYQDYPWYPITITHPERRKTGLTIEGTPEEVADLIRHFACRLKITIESLGEEDN